VDSQIARTKDWALASDKLQWILQRRRTRAGQEEWRPVSFVRSTKQTLSWCMREKGVPAVEARQLLWGLPSTFDTWLEASGAGVVDLNDHTHTVLPEIAKTTATTSLEAQ
jgi:hypothetical protein